MWPLAKLVCAGGRGHTTVREVEAYPVRSHEIQLFGSQENRKNCCHQMSDFKAKMHQFDFGWGSAPDPAGGAVGAYSSPRPPS